MYFFVQVTINYSKITFRFNVYDLEVAVEGEGMGAKISISVLATTFQMFNIYHICFVQIYVHTSRTCILFLKMGVTKSLRRIKTSLLSWCATMSHRRKAETQFKVDDRWISFPNWHFSVNSQKCTDNFGNPNSNVWNVHPAATCTFPSLYAGAMMGWWLIGSSHINLNFHRFVLTKLSTEPAQQWSSHFPPSMFQFIMFCAKDEKKQTKKTPQSSNYLLLCSYFPLTRAPVWKMGKPFYQSQLPTQQLDNNHCTVCMLRLGG